MTEKEAKEKLDQCNAEFKKTIKHGPRSLKFQVAYKKARDAWKVWCAVTR